MNPIIEMVPLYKITPYARNSKAHPKEQIEKIAKQIHNVGFLVPIVVDKEFVIITGHGRYEAAKSLNLEFVPTIIAANLNEEQTKAWRIADNKVAESEWDLPMLSFELGTLDRLGVDLTLSGFNLDEAKTILSSIEPQELKTESDPLEDILPEKVEPKVKPGDIYKLGRHRLMCGDATSFNDVEKLIGVDVIDMLYTDPPYGVKEKTNRKSSGRGQLAENQDFDPVIGDESNETAIKSIEVAKYFKFPVQIFWGANYYCHALPEISSWIVWDKRDGVKSDDNADLELAWCNTGKPARLFAHLWKGCVRASEKDEKKVHPTQKPVALATWCFENFGNPQNVLDLFLGSGSTLIACEKTNRSCFGMELSPQYCDIIVARWELMTGQKALPI